MQNPRLVLSRGVWCVTYTNNGKPKRVSLRTSDRDAAEREFNDLKIKASQKLVTVGDIMTAWIEEKHALVSIVRARVAVDKYLAPRFAAFLPEQITKPVCRDFIAFRRKAKCSDWTIRRELGVLRSALYWHDKYTKARFELPPQGSAKERYLTKEEAATLMECAKAEHIKLFVGLAIATAGRMGAILDLTWDRVDFARETINLSKGSNRIKGRALVPMTKSIKVSLERAYLVRTSDYVVEHGGKPIANVKKGVAAAACRAKLPDVSPHVLRHTAAVWMAEARVPMAEIAQYLGHTDTRITEKHYARFSPTHLRMASSALEM